MLVARTYCYLIGVHVSNWFVNLFRYIILFYSEFILLMVQRESLVVHLLRRDTLDNLHRNIVNLCIICTVIAFLCFLRLGMNKSMVY